MGLIEAVTMALTVGMKKLSECQIIIRRFSGAEALASATVICSDKTGIMTQNRMTVKKVFVDGHIMDVGAYLIHAVGGFYDDDPISGWFTEYSDHQVNGFITAVPYKQLVTGYRIQA